MESERLPRSTSFQRIRSRSKAGTSGFDLPPERSYSRAGSVNSSAYGCASGVSPMRSPMPAYRSKLVSFPGDENVDPTSGMDIGQPTPLKMREERPDYHTTTADSALRGGAVPRTVAALVPQQQAYRADPYNGQTVKSARGILVDSPRHVSNPNRGPMSPIGAADTYCRSTTPPPAGGRTSRAASSSMTPRRRRNKDKRQEAEQNLAFYDDSFVEEFVLCAKEEMSAKENAAKKAAVANANADDTTTTGRSSSKANSILLKEKERLRSSKHRSSSKRHHNRKSHLQEEIGSCDGSGDSANESIGSEDDSVEMRSNTSRRGNKRNHKHHHSKKHNHHDAEEEIDPEEEYQALEHARRSASRKAVVAAPASKGKRARSLEGSDIDERSNDMDGDSYTSSSSEDFTDSKGVQRHRRHRRHHHSRSRNTSPIKASTTTTAAPSILLNPVDMKPAPRRRGARRESVVAFTDSHPLGNDKPIRAGRSPSLRSNDGDAPVVLGRHRGGKKAVSEEPHELLGRLQSVERPVLLGRSRRAADLMQQEVVHRANVITAASAVPVARQRGGKAAAARKAATTTTTTSQDIFEGLDDNDDASTPLRQQPSHHAHVLQAASRHNTAVKSAGIKSNDPMAVFFESAFPTPSRFDEMASMTSAPPVGRRKNNGNFPLMLPTTIAKGTKRRA